MYYIMARNELIIMHGGQENVGLDFRVNAQTASF